MGQLLFPVLSRINSLSCATTCELDTEGRQRDYKKSGLGGRPRGSPGAEEMVSSFLCIWDRVRRGVQAEAGGWGRAVVMVLWGEQSIRVRASPNLLSTLEPLAFLGVEAALSMLRVKPPSLMENRSFAHGRTARLDSAGIRTSVLWFHAAVSP